MHWANRLAILHPMIDKVGYTKPVLNAKALKKATKAGASGFASALGEAEAALESSEVEGPQQTAALNANNPLLGFQEVDTADYEKRRAVKHGRVTLEALSQLRDALLMGSLPVSSIEKLERLVASERTATMDPVLNGILDEIELRAAVEMAKLEVAMQQKAST